jgi:hypothetical protein
MTALPAYLIVASLLLLAMLSAHNRARPTIVQQQQVLATELLACHQALVTYANANAGKTGVIAASLVDAQLEPGAVDPGSLVYLIATGTTPIAVTYLPSAPASASIAIAQAQLLAGNTIFAGPVVNGQIVPTPPTPPIAAPAGVPNGAIAIATVL